MHALLSIAGTTMLGFGGAPWWTLIIGAVFLAFSPIWENRTVRYSFPNISSSEMIGATVLTFAPIAIVFATACFGIGRGLAFLLS